ncbi:MAG: tetratricopeptide repeat protein, partial [Flavobacteriales bacterium]
MYIELDEAKEDSTVIRLELQISDSLLFHMPDSAILHARRALTMAEQQNDVLSCAEAYNNIGIVATIQGNYLTGTENFQLALQHYEKDGNLVGAAKILNNLGVIYETLENHKKSITHHHEGYKLAFEIGDYEGAATNLFNIAAVHLEVENYDSSLFYVNKLNEFQAQYGEFYSPAPVIGSAFLAQNQLDSAEHYLKISEKNSLQINDETQRISAVLGLSEVKLGKGLYAEALNYLLKIESSIRDNQFNDELLDVYSLKSEIYSKTKNYDLALANQKAYINLKDSLDQLNNFNRLSELNAKYESEKREKEIAEKEALLVEQKASEASQRKLFLIISLFVLIFILVLLYSFIKKKKTNRILNKQNLEISEQRSKIISSINYAKKIQNSILIPEKQIRRYLPESFVYFKPKDIVSGDFYWFSHIGDKFIIATIDCTGHGVPGAFMSLIANAKLNKVVNEKRIYDPGLILSEVHHEIFNSLNQEAKSHNAQDGMDMSLCVIDQNNKVISFAGAQNSIYLVKDEKAHEVKADNYSIGGSFYMNEAMATFNTKKFTYNHGT